MRRAFIAILVLVGVLALPSVAFDMDVFHAYQVGFLLSPSTHAELPPFTSQTKPQQYIRLLSLAGVNYTRIKNTHVL